MTASPSSSPPAKRPDAGRCGLNGWEWGAIAGILLVGVGLAGILMLYAPGWVVSAQDYRCPPAALAAVSDVSASCLGAAGTDGIDDQALNQALTAARTSFGLLSAGLLAGAAAAIGVVISNHNAALTRDALHATVKANKMTKKRDEAASTRERERAADERFTTAIEQLGHPSASVRLGGMHSLHRLAESASERLPTVVDVLCAYLRQPFHHPDHDWNHFEDESDEEPPARAWWPVNQKERDERDSEREVRSTATRLIPTLLPKVMPVPHATDASELLGINLNGAMLDGLDFSARRIGHLRLDNVHIAGEPLLDNVHITGDLSLGDAAHITGDLRLDNVRITGSVLLGDDAHIDGQFWFLFGARIGDGILLGNNAHIDSGVWLGCGTHLGDVLRLGAGAHIDGGLSLAEDVRLGAGIEVGPRAHITGGLHLRSGAHIDNALSLGAGAHIDGGLSLGDDASIRSLRLGAGAHIDSLQLETGAVVQGVRLHAEAAMDASWFEERDIPLM